MYHPRCITTCTTRGLALRLSQAASSSCCYVSGTMLHYQMTCINITILHLFLAAYQLDRGLYVLCIPQIAISVCLHYGTLHHSGCVTNFLQEIRTCINTNILCMSHSRCITEWTVSPLRLHQIDIHKHPRAMCRSRCSTK